MSDPLVRMVAALEQLAGGYALHVGWGQKLGIAWSALGGWLGLAELPGDDPGKVARIGEMYAEYRREFEGVPEVDAVTALGWLQEGSVVFVDVRTERERAVSMLPGAVSAEQVEQDPQRYQGQVLVAYCTIGYRSGLWAEEQRERGLQVSNLAGSLLSWTHAGGPLLGPAGPTNEVHVYGATWNLVHSGYQAVW
jgi:rhodanese-related sulfurtransferase